MCHKKEDRELRLEVKCLTEKNTGTEMNRSQRLRNETGEEVNKGTLILDLISLSFSDYGALLFCFLLICIKQAQLLKAM